MIELNWKNKSNIKYDKVFELENNSSKIDSSVWKNKLIYGDNKQILSTLKNGKVFDEIKNNGGLKLIYIDPPFNVGKVFKNNNGITAYNDKWEDVDSFLQMIYERLILMKDLLADDGSIYVHCDWRVSAHMRLLLDEIFGCTSFINEIIWHYKTFQGQTRRYFAKKHDTIFIYSNSKCYSFNQIFDTDVDNAVDKVGWKKYLNENNQIIGTNMPVQDIRFLRYLKRWKNKFKREPIATDIIFELKGQPIDSVWDLKAIDPKSKDKFDYPTQKPEALLERIILASSNSSDLVADFFCGSGTTLAVAEKLNRKWIGADVGDLAIETTKNRLMKLNSNFEVLKIKNADE